ncbi:cytochrome bc complex cytochrome b subunit [Candidatus Methylomirabilis limnetica]|uniref:Cytochrome bc complex cytochrome b subunit n=2 Tax=Candidatus Methylomirabilis limnetica TaxID=2033718 RepID=A0A2T4U151_9BACT|nr:cytochrome bc complex cytochrome b subunit [Candidatus Methylomirabilis limnetica]
MMGDRITAWLEERIDLSALKHLIQKKVIPVHRHTVWYYVGGMTLFLFGIQVATGILLTLYYRPSSEEAYESVQFIVTEVQFGWLVRSIHSWSANLMVLTMMIHMFSVYLTQAYRKPRELTWVTGILLFGIVLFFGFSGYLLPWNVLSYFATKVGTEVTGQLPIVGHFLVRLLRAGDEVSGATLSRFFGIHIAILPALTTLILALHLLLVQKQGMSVPATVERAQAGQPLRTMPFVPNFLLRDLFGWFAALGLLAALAAMYPWELGQKADPFAPAPAGIRPEWYFVFMFQSLKYIPAKVGPFDGEVLGVLGYSLGGLFLLLVPFLDKRTARGEPSPLFRWIGIGIIAYIVILTALGYFAPAFK